MEHNSQHKSLDGICEDHGEQSDLVRRVSAGRILTLRLSFLQQEVQLTILNVVNCRYVEFWYATDEQRMNRAIVRLREWRAGPEVLRIEKIDFRQWAES